MKKIKNYKSFIESLINETSQSEVDNILDKINMTGYESLSKKEKETLSDADLLDVENPIIDYDGDININGEKLNKRPREKVWSYLLEDEIMEYLFSNFIRTGKQVEDILGQRISKEEISRKVFTFFNTELPEVDSLVDKWYGGLLTEKISNYNPSMEQPLKFGEYKGKTPTEVSTIDLDYLKRLLKADIRWKGGYGKSTRTLTEIENAVKNAKN